MKLPPRPVLTLIAAGVLITSLLISAIGQQIIRPTQQNSSGPSVEIDGYTFFVTIADTPQKQHRGLGGVTHLANNQGMYFPLQGQSDVAFWMKDMLIPIDIIWIKDGRIVGINANVPAPATNTPDNQLPLYYAPVPQPDAVLEIASNRVSQLHLNAGDTIELILH